MNRNKLLMAPSSKTKTPSSKPSEKATGAQPRYFSRAVGKAMQILEMLQSTDEPPSLNDVAKLIRLSKTSAFRLLRTLEVTGHLVTTETGQYQLAPGIQSSAPAQHVMKLIRVAAPQLEELNRELGETVTAAALFENRIEVVAMVESQHIIRMSNVVGHILPPHASSLGKAITAYQSPERREKLLRSYGLCRFTSTTITDRGELKREFDTIREQRFANDREESVQEGLCYGVPIFGPNDTVVSAISTSVPKLRIRDAQQEKEIVSVVSAAAEKLSRILRTV